MRVAVVCNLNKNPSGMEYHIAEACSNMVRRGMDVMIVSNPPSQRVLQAFEFFGTSWDRFDHVVTSFESGPIRGLINLLAPALPEIQECDAVHCHDISLAGYLASRHPNVLTTFHGIAPQAMGVVKRDIGGFLFFPYEYFAVRNSKSLVFVTSMVSQLARELYGRRAGAGHVIWNGADPSRFVPQRENAESFQASPLVCVMGPLERRRGIDIILRAIAVARSKLPNIGLLMIGQSNDSTPLDSIIAELNLSDSVIREGYVDIFQLPTYISRCDIAMNLSWDVQRTLFEQMACGIPPIVPARGSYGDVVEDGFNGFVLNRATPESLAEAIVSLAEDDNLRSDLARQARDTILNRFDSRILFSRLESLLRTLAKDATPFE